MPHRSCFAILIAVAATAAAAATACDAGGLATPQPPVPVTVATVAVHDVPVVREGLGTVQALNTATIRVQVSGMLEEVAFKEGQVLKKGELIARIDPRPFQAVLEEAQATMARDQAVLDNAKLNLDRTQPLATRGYASNQALDTQSAAVRQDESTLKIDEARVDAAAVQLGFTTITAPFDGVTGLRLVDVGNIVHPADASGLVVLTQVKPITAVFALPTADIPAVQAALAKGAVEALAYGADDQTLLDRGTLLLINNRADPASGTVQLKARFPNAADRLWPGTFVNVHVVVAVARGGTTVPLSALQQGPDGPYVWVVGADDAARMRPVAVEQSRDGVALLSRGVKGGERVVATGQYGLAEGAKAAVVSGEAAGAVQRSTAATSGLLP